MIRPTRVLNPSLVVAVTLAAVALVVGASTASAADPNGTWKWKFTTQNGQEFEMSLELKQDGEKLTGQLTRGERTSEISEGKFKNDEVTFDIVRERDGQKITSHYKGKVEGDSITGQIEFEFGGEARSFDWNATREKK